MSGPNQEAISTFISITSASEAVALRKLEDHGGDLNAAVNAFFSEGDRNVVHETTIASDQDDHMDIDDPTVFSNGRSPLSPLLEASMKNPFSLLDPHFQKSILNGAPFVLQPREVREIPIEVKDGCDAPSHSDHAPIIEDITGTEQECCPGIHGTVIVADEDEDIVPTGLTAREALRNEQSGFVSFNSSREAHSRPSAPHFDDLPDYSNDIEEEMIQVAIEASKWESQESSDPGPQKRFPLDDAELADAVSLSLKTAAEEKAMRDQKGKVGTSKVKASEEVQVESGKIVTSNGRLRTPSSSFQDEASDSEDQPLLRHRSGRTSVGSIESTKEVNVTDGFQPSSPGQNEIGTHLLHNGSAFESDEWGGISSEEHDEAVMLEAAMFGVHEGTGYQFDYAPHQFLQPDEPYHHCMPRPPSPSLQAQRIIREQQDDEYLASLTADQEKEMKAMEAAEVHRLQEEAAKLAAFEEERRIDEESHRKLEEDQALERQLAAKEASLPQEPGPDDENAITLLVRMPDGSRHGRRFLRSNNLQSLFDFIDIGRVVKPGTYRLVRPYPRRAFSDGDTAMTLNELGLTSKQEALFLESL